MHKCEFKVKGQSLFPLDMLRYDRCYPRTQEDVAAISERVHPAQGNEEVEIELVSISKSKEWVKPSEDRWLSFQWPVVSESIRIRKT